MLGGILRLPTSLKYLTIKDNSGLTSLEPVSGPPPLSLECLDLIRCSTLASLPNEPQAYGSLQLLVIKDCPAIKKLPRCLQQRLGSIDEKDLDAQYEGTHIFQVLSCQLDGLPKPEVTASINVPNPPAATSAGEHSLPSCLTYLKIESCAGMLGGILRLPTSLKTLSIKDNSGLTSLEPVSGPPPLSLEYLRLESCSTLASLPNEPQPYGSLQHLIIKDCPAIKKLPRCLQQRLGSIRIKDLDAQYEVMAFKPKTWKKIPRLVRERKEAKTRAEQRRKANHTIEEHEAE